MNNNEVLAQEAARLIKEIVELNKELADKQAQLAFIKANIEKGA